MTALRVLFATQGQLGTAVLGHGTAALAFAVGMEGVDDVEGRFVAVGPRNRLSEAVLRQLPVLSALDLDLFALRFHLSESVRGLALMLRELRREPADVVHVTTHTLGLLAGPVRGRVPVVLNVDAAIWDYLRLGHLRPDRPWRRLLLTADLALERRALQRADLVVAWSEWAAAGVRRAAPRANVAVLHPGLDTERMRPADERRPGPVRVLFVGARLEPKGGLELLEAMAPLLQRGGAELDLVTTETLDPRPGVRTHRLAAGDADLVELFRQADVFCLPSRGDSVPWAVLEALACGTAVVGSAVGAIPEMLCHGAAGVVVPPRDVGALRAAVEGLVADENRRRALSAEGRRVVLARYEVHRQSAALAALLREVVAQRSRASAARPSAKKRSILSR